MRRFLQSGLTGIAAVALLAPAAPALASSGGIGGSGGSLAPVGSAAAVPSTATTLGALPSDQTISFDVVLKPRSQTALDQFVHDVSTPGSAHYHQFLETGEYAQRFGPTPQTVASVTDQMKHLGLTVKSVHGSVVQVAAPAATVSNALHTSFKQYRLKSGRIARANVIAPKLPTSVSPYVQGVVGLDTVTQASHPVPTAKPQLRSAAIATASTSAPTVCFAEQTNSYYSANQLASYYGLNSYWNAGNFGAGMTIAMFELESYNSSDVNYFQTSCTTTNASVTNVPVDGGAVFDPSASNWGLEATLDIEGAIGLAPGAAIDVYEAPNTGQGILDNYAAIANDNSSQVVSTSWGICEASINQSFADSERQIFQQMAAQGQTVFAAAGDHGSTDCDYNPPNTSAALAVDDPASQPEVTGVGGTDLTTNTGPETPWNNGLDSNSVPVGGGGGISSLWSMPSWQQSLGVVGDSSGTPCGATAGSYCREVPDVSASADPNDGYVVYYGGQLMVVGGTSAAAPLWGSLLALVDSSCPGNRLGLINPALYQLDAQNSAAFNDVTSGNNDASGTNGGLYPALTGYDMATGLGTPVAKTVGSGLCPAPSDGSGTTTVDRTSVPASSADTLTFTYTAPNGNALYDGEVSLQVPADWTKPSTTAGSPGYTTSSSGTVSITGTAPGPWTIDVQHADTLAGALTIVYGDKSAGGPGATAPAAVEVSQFNAESAGTSAGTLTALSTSPSVGVGLAADGSGTMALSPTTLNANQATTLAFTYQAPAGGGLSNGEVDLVVPSGWTQPTTSSGAGYVTVTGGSGANTLTVSPGGAPWTIAVTGVSLNPSATLQLTYGDSTGSGLQATAPADGQPYVFATSEKSFAGGALKPLASSPSVQVNGPAADGSGTMSASLTSVTTGSAQTLTFTYSPPTGATVTSGEVTVAVPTTWTTPSPTPAAGYVTAAGGTGTNAVTVDASGATPVIVVNDVVLASGQQLAIVYGDTTNGGAKATSPASAETTTFTTTMANGGGTATALAASPSVSVTAPPPPSGGGGGGGGGAFGHPDLTRVAGADRIATSVAASQAAFPKASSARVAVLARADSFADALSGTPLAASEGGPLLLTNTATAPAATLAELDRVLPRGDTIFLLGGASAISTGVQTQLTGMGYAITRLAGADRYATAVAVAGALGNPTTVFEADGTNFPDALSAGSAAAQQGAAVLLTSSARQAAATAGYLSAHPSVRYAVGGPAAKADPGATPFVGADRFATSVLVAKAFFNAPLSVGLASGMNFPDALSGGAVTANHGGPILLVPSSGTVPAGTTGYLTNTAALSASSAWLFGGAVSVSDSVYTQSAAALKVTAS